MLKKKPALQKLQVSPAAFALSDEEFYSSILYGTEGIGGNVIKTYLTKDSKFLIQQKIMGVLALIHLYIGNQCDFQILAEPFGITGSVSGEGLDHLLKLLIQQVY